MKNFFVIILFLCAANLNAQSSLDIDIDNDGLIEVSNLETLNAIRYQLNGSGLRMNADAEKVTSGCAVGGCKGYELTGDLDFLDAANYKDITNLQLWTSGVGWQPIGDNEHPFNAVFKTNNSSTPHTIFNLTINRGNEDNVGLFGSIGSAAEISGIGLLDVDVTGRHRVGGLVGVNGGGRVSNSYASGHVVGSGGAVGLLVGSNSGAITNSYADGEVSGKDNSVGGLVGVNGGNLSNSYAIGNVVGKANNVGGLVGDNSQGTINNSYASASVSGSEDIGGLVGLSNLGTLVKNYVSGKATGIRYVGGLVGMNIGGTVSYSYWDKTASALEGNSDGVGLSASELQSASAQNDDLNKPFYQWSTADWDFGSDEQYPILKYTIGTDANNPACGPEPSLPNCGSLLLGQHSSLKRIILLADATLTPRFKPTQFNYHLNITPAIKQLQLIPVANNPNSIISISMNSTATVTDLASGTTSTAITLDADTELTIAVSAPNQRPAQYQLTVNYLPTIIVSGMPSVAMDEGKLVILDASPSNDVEGEPLSYQWTQSVGKTIDLEITDQPVLILRIPEDYVSEHATDAELGITVAVSDGKATASQAIRIDINKIDNGTVTVAAPTPSATAWTAPKINLSDDPDGVGSNLQYQWQSRTPDNNAEWTDIDQATQQTYTPSILTTIGTQYRVRINYTDGQGYATTLLGDAATYQPEIVTLDFAKAQATESQSPSTTPTTTTMEEFKCETIKYTEDIDDNNNGLIDICDLEDLNAMRYQLNGTGYRASAGATEITTGCPDGGCKGYELMTDLDFLDNASYSSTSNKVIWTTGEGWQPIGYYTNYNDNKPFKAIFDGNNHTISNLMINRPRTSNLGLFSYIASASTITNIGLLNVNIQGNRTAGSLVGHSSGSITNSYATGTVSGNSSIGGLVGYSNGSIKGSYAAATVSGSSSTGGLVGSSNYGGRITNSFATGTVTGGLYAGGLVGFSYQSSITNSYATDAVSGSLFVGGLFGFNINSGVTNSYATGAVTGGGIVGGLVSFSNLYGGTNSYWDIQTSGITNSAGGTSKTTVELQSPTTATGIYSDWSSDVWDFGSDKQYPVLKKSDGTLLSPALRYGLKELRLAKGHLSPDFVSAVPDYTGSMVNTTGTIQLIPIAIDPSSLIRIMSSGIDETINNSDTSSNIRLSEDSITTITIVVTTDEETVQYNLNIDYYHFSGDVDNDNDGRIEIDSIKKLNAIRYQPDGTGYRKNSTTPKITEGCPATGCIGYELTTDLSFEANSDYSDWLPIRLFSGIFEGNHYTISNLKIDRPTTDYVGLFGSVLYGAKINNIGLLNVNVRGKGYVGGLVGDSSGSITNSYAIGAVSGNSRVGGIGGVGGLVGSSNSGSITDSYATGVVSGNKNVGGLVGNSYWGSSITDSYATGTVTGNERVGGLVGSSHFGSISITNSYATGAVSGNEGVGGLVGYHYNGSISITNSYATGAVSGREYVGGLVGYNYSYNYRDSITNSYATGVVTGTDDYVGGLVGYWFRGNITNSYATGAVSGNENVGGLVGLVGYNSYGSITNSYATGAVKGNERVGGLVGSRSSGSITNSYWDIQTSGIASSDGGTSKTTVELQSPTGAVGIYGDWSSDDWDFGSASQYPVLKYATNCGASGQPTCGTPLLGQYPNLLANLELSDISLSPAFDPYTFRYEVEVDNNISTIKLTAVTTASDAYLSISSNIDGSIISEPHSAEDIAVDLAIVGGATVITIEVTQGNRRPTSYILTVSRRDDDDSSSLPSRLQVVANSVQPIEEGTTASLQATLDSGSCSDDNLRCEWGYFDTAKRLSVFDEDSDLLNFTVPKDYVDADQSTQELVVVFAIANDNGIAREKVSLIVEKIDNDSLSLGQPTLDGRLLTAPKIDLASDADGVSADPAISYQWQRKERGNNWVKIDHATAMTYTINTEYAALHRVQISYTDGQGFCYGEMQNCTNPESAISSQPIRNRDIDDDGLIEIKYLDELDAIRHQLDKHNNNTTGSDVYKGYELVADLDFANDASYLNLENQERWTTSTGWIPIGDDDLSFSGTLKGNGHTISNLMINKKNAYYVGLFSMISEGAMIDGVDLYRIDVKGHSNIGGLVAKNAGGIIINSSLSGDDNATVNSIKGKGVKIGGLVGENMGYIINSYVDADITTGSRVGGLVGRNRGWIINSYAAGSVTADEYVGGLVGWNLRSGRIINSYAISAVTGNKHIGNLVGSNGRNSIIESSYWNNEINNNITNDDRGTSKTTVELQSPTTATAIYKKWNDNVWDFGTESQYPALKYANIQCSEKDGYCGGLSEDQKTLLQSLCTKEDAPAYCRLLPGQRFGLQSLELNNAILIEDFSNETYSYKVLIGNETTSTGIIPLAVNPNAEIELTKGDGSGARRLIGGDLNLIELASGNSTLTIVVEDNRSKIPYILNVTRFSIGIGLVNDTDGLVNDIDPVNNPPYEGDSLGAKIKAMPAMAEISYQWNGDLFATTATNQSISPEISATYVMSADTDKRTAIVELAAILRYKSQQIESRTTKELQIKKKDNGSITALGSLTVDMSQWKLTAPELLMNANNGYDPEGIKEKSVSYQWHRQSAKAEWKMISGATGSTYAIPQATPAYTEYRVDINYKDNQSYSKILMSSSYIYKVADRDGNGWINIYTAEQLNAIRHQLHGSGYREDATTTSTSLGCPDNECNGYELKAHIDLSELDEDWQPLGSDVDRFDVIFEGNHYTISNLTITTTTDYVGLFAAISANAEIRNVGLLNVEINANNYVGGLVGHNKGTIAYSHVVGKSIAGASNVGALIGFNSGHVGDVNYAKMDALTEGTTSVCKLIGNYGTIESNKLLGSYDDNGLFQCFP